MALHVGQQSAIDLAHYSRCTFEGEAPVRCTLFDGPVQDLNVMVARDRASEITEVLRPGIAMQRHAIHGASLLLHCRGGAAVIGLDDDRAFDLKDGDTLRIDAATPSCGSFSIAAAVSTSPAVIAILITLLHQGERAMSDSVAAKAL